MKPQNIIFKISNLHTWFCGSGLKKYALVFFVFHFSFFVTQAQTLSATDFIPFTTCPTADCFVDRVIAHGYTPIMYSPTANVFAEPGGTNCADNTAAYLTHGISYTTADTNRYTTLATQFTSLGFSNMLKKGKKGTTLAKSPSYPGINLTVIAYSSANKCGMPCLWYNITVEKK